MGVDNTLFIPREIALHQYSNYKVGRAQLDNNNMVQIQNIYNINNAKTKIKGNTVHNLAVSKFSFISSGNRFLVKKKTLYCIATPISTVLRRKTNTAYLAKKGNLISSLTNTHLAKLS